MSFLSKQKNLHLWICVLSSVMMAHSSLVTRWLWTPVRNLFLRRYGIRGPILLNDRVKSGLFWAEPIPQAWYQDPCICGPDPCQLPGPKSQWLTKS